MYQKMKETPLGREGFPDKGVLLGVPGAAGTCAPPKPHDGQSEAGWAVQLGTCQQPPGTARAPRSWAWLGGWTWRVGHLREAETPFLGGQGNPIRNCRQVTERGRVRADPEITELGVAMKRLF